MTVSNLQTQWVQEFKRYAAECDTLVTEIEADITLELLKPRGWTWHCYSEGLRHREQAMDTWKALQTAAQLSYARVEIQSAFQWLELAKRQLAVQNSFLARGLSFMDVEDIPRLRTQLEPLPPTPPAPARPLWAGWRVMRIVALSLVAAPAVLGGALLLFVVLGTVLHW